MNQFSANNGLIINLLSDLLYNSTTEDLIYKIYDMYLPMAYECYFGGFIYLKISLDVMFCITMEVFQALHDSIKNFGRSVIAGEPVKNISDILSS